MPGSDFPEPLSSICPDTWAVYADFCSDHDDPVGEARARRIAQTLASGRTGLWLEHTDRTGEAYTSGIHWGSNEFAFAPDSYRWTPSPPPNAGDGRPINPTWRPHLFADRPDLARAFFDKLHDLGPLLWLAEGGDTTVSVPADVAVCPECGGELLGTVEAWATETGEPEEVALNCAREPGWNDEEWEHHYWHQSDWQSTHDAVERWARDTVRVRTREAAKEGVS